MKRFALSLLLASALAAPAAAQMGDRGGPGEGGRSRMAYANPSAGIAADIALSQLTAGKKGRWFALRQTAAPDAVMFVPHFVLAQPWLKGRKAVAPVLKLQPYQAWASCDGSLVVTSGARQDGDIPGWYTNVWQRQPDGGYKWVFGHDGALKAAIGATDTIDARVAECPLRRRAGEARPSGGKPAKAPPIILDPRGRSGSSNDGSLTWQVTADPGGAHRFTASMLVNGKMAAFRDEQVAASGS